MPSRSLPRAGGATRKTPQRRNLIRVEIIGIFFDTYRDLLPSEADTLRLAVRNYGSVLHSWAMRGHEHWLRGFSFDVWAREIRTVYDQTVPQTATVLKLLDELHMEEGEYLKLAG